MVYKNILVAFDGSSASEHALSSAQEFVECGLAEKIIILSVGDPTDVDDYTFEIAARMANVKITTETEDEVLKLVEKAKELSKSFSNVTEVVSRIGKPQKAIIAAAKEYECELIVMGNRGLGAIRGALGSVSHAILRDAEVPVFIIK